MSNQEDSAAQPHTGAPADAYTRFVHDTIQKRWRALENSAPTAQTGEDVEALHQLRVAARRLRTTIHNFATVLPPKRAKRSEKLLRKVMRVVGAPREWDVHGETLARLHAATPSEIERAAIEHVLELVDVRRSHERAEMVRRLAKIELDKIGRDIRWLADHVASAGRPADLAHVAQSLLEPLAREAFASLGRQRERERPDELHAVRIACKHLRYALELLEPAFADGHARLLSRCRHLQDLLGRHHDLFMLEELLTRTLGRLNEHGRATLAEGLLGPLERLRSERRDQYVEFCGATATLDSDSFIGEIRRGLRVD